VTQLFLLVLVLTSSLPVYAQRTVFKEVKIRRHRSSKKRVLVDKFGTLTFDDSARKLTFQAEEAGDHIEISYDDVQKIVFEITTHMRGGAVSQVIEAASIPGLVVGNAIARQHVHDYWFYVECKCPAGDKAALIDVPKGYSAQVIEKARSVFGSKVTETDFAERSAEVNIENLKALKTKQVAKVDKRNHPLPGLTSDKATLIVVCPPLAARYAGTGIQFKLHANDQVIAVNRMGTYSFAYLDPGKYLLVSQAENANGFEMELKGGQIYYFLQNTFQQTIAPNQTALSRDSKELVMYLLNGSYFSDWKPKEPKKHAQI
jgi:hypothetical protein